MPITLKLLALRKAHPIHSACIAFSFSVCQFYYCLTFLCFLCYNIHEKSLRVGVFCCGKLIIPYLGWFFSFFIGSYHFSTYNATILRRLPSSSLPCVFSCICASGSPAPFPLPRSAAEHPAPGRSCKQPRP